MHKIVRSLIKPPALALIACLGVAGLLDALFTVCGNTLDDSRVRQVEISRIESHCNRLAYMVDDAAQGEGVTGFEKLRPKTDLAVKAFRVHASPEGTGNLNSIYQAFIAKAAVEVAAAKAGKLALARQIDVQSVDPALTALQSEINNLGEKYRRQAESAGVRMRILTGITLLLSAVFFAGLYSRHREKSLRNQALRDEIRESQALDVELQQSRQVLQEFIDAMSTFAVKVAPDGMFLIVNKVAAEASGLGREEVMTVNFLDGPWWAFDPEVQTRVRERFQLALAGTAINYEERIFAFGQVLTISFSLTPVCDTSGMVTYIVAEGRDISEIKKTEMALQEAKEEAERANLEKSEFLSRMSHELRTPLNAILGFGQILELQEKGPQTRESVGHILKGGRHLLGLVNEVLDLARIESGNVDLSMEPLIVKDVIQDACSLVTPLASERNIRLLQVVNRDEDTLVRADAQRLKQVLLNLLSNAIKYNRNEGEVELRWESAPGSKVLIHVRDTGPGMTPEDMAKLFTPFERLGYNHSAVQGTGLGLVLSQRLVEAMGGRLFAISEPNVGSTFTIELAAADPIAHLATEFFSDNAEPVGPVERRYTVLAIEDNPSNLRLLKAILALRPEISLLSAIQGSIGIDLATQFAPDLILLDLNLPDMSGMQVLARLRNSDITHGIPVVVVSADANPSQIERLLHAGAADYLTKPFHIPHFLKLLDDRLPKTPTIPAVAL